MAGELAVEVRAGAVVRQAVVSSERRPAATMGAMRIRCEADTAPAAASGGYSQHGGGNLLTAGALDLRIVAGGGQVAAKSAGFTLKAEHHTQRIPVTSGVTVVVSSAAVLGPNFECWIYAVGVTVTLDGPGATNVSPPPALAARVSSVVMVRGHRRRGQHRREHLTHAHRLSPRRSAKPMPTSASWQPASSAWAPAICRTRSSPAAPSCLATTCRSRMSRPTPTAFSPQRASVRATWRCWAAGLEAGAGGKHGDNLALLLSDEQRKTLGYEIKREIDIAKRSRLSWIDLMVKAVKRLGFDRETEKRSDPFPGVLRSSTRPSPRPASTSRRAPPG